jgi:hypothetical protein
MSKLLSTRWIVAVSATATLGASAAVILWAPPEFPCWYTEHLRTDFFSASLTMAGFLFTVATFIVAGVKTGIYDSPQYRQRFAKAKLLEPTLSLYAPLRGLTHLLVAATAMCLLCAIVHVALGFLSTRWSVAVCVASAVATSTVVLFAIWAARVNFLDWLEHDETPTSTTEPASR